jgi:hypothetical protein
MSTTVISTGAGLKGMFSGTSFFHACVARTLRSDEGGR